MVGILFTFLLYSLYSSTLSEVIIPANPVPFQNLIPRFKMPPGNLLRYRIPQWEVLYFLKYGIVPFIFYDPNFNRTNFITQVHKFKMYFDNVDLPNKTADNPIKDEKSFREFLKIHGFPYYDQLPDNAYNKNQKVAEEILQAAKNQGEPEVVLPEEKLNPIEIFLKNLEERSRKESNLTGTILKKSAQRLFNKSFWNAFINRYPLSWKYSKTLLGSQEPVLEHAKWTADARIGPVQVRSYLKPYRIGIRNANPEEIGDDDHKGGGGGDGGRRGGKNFQTQGW